MSPKEFSEDVIENTKLPVKTVVVIILWIGSLMGLYFKMQASVEAAQNVALEALSISKQTQEKWNTSNIALLTFRVDELTSSVKDIQKSTNEVKDLLRRR